MASPANPEASEVRRRGRQRLIGAIALVAVLVVFVPMVLDKEPAKQRGGPELAIPSKTNAPPLPAPPAKDVTAAKDVTPAKAGAQSLAAGAPSPEAGRQPKTDPKVAESKVLESKAPAPPKAPPAVMASAPATAPVTPAQAGTLSANAPKLEGFAVQVGAFRDEAKLEQARQKLAAAKVPHYTERLEAKSGPLTRLRAGPFKTREAAESALAELKLSALDGKVVPLP
jgi:DedD protein